jgi:hypothetical protein
MTAVRERGRLGGGPNLQSPIQQSAIFNLQSAICNLQSAVFND